jgi:hypothetical protein
LKCVPLNRMLRCAGIQAMSKLTAASKGSTCIKCEAPGAYACHINGPRQHSLGKGRGIKADDLMTAEFCHSCDQEFSEGSMMKRWNFNRWERSEEFLFWISMTNVRRLKNGIIKI